MGASAHHAQSLTVFAESWTTFNPVNSMPKRALLVEECHRRGISVGKKATVVEMKRLLTDAGVDIKSLDRSSVDLTVSASGGNTPIANPNGWNENDIAKIVAVVVDTMSKTNQIEDAAPTAAGGKRGARSSSQKKPPPKKKNPTSTSADSESEFSSEEEEDMPLSSMFAATGKMSNSANTGNPESITTSPPMSSTQPTPIALRYPIPDAVKRAVLNQKHVPIYKLLHGYDGQMQNQLVSSTEEDGAVRLVVGGQSSRDRKLDKQPLDIGQLVLGLNKYKSIIKEVSPERGDDIDSYISNVISIQTRYPGYAYWSYHCLFWQRAFECSLEGAPIDWRVLDPEALHAAIANCGGPNYCAHCHIFSHATAKCPFHSVKVLSEAVDVQAVSAFDAAQPPPGKDICTYFNSSTCRNNRCGRRHVCMFCNRSGHAMTKCPVAPKNA